MRNHLGAYLKPKITTTPILKIRTNYTQGKIYTFVLKNNSHTPHTI
jgi:hypothetical protein